MKAGPNHELRRMRSRPGRDRQHDQANPETELTDSDGSEVGERIVMLMHSDSLTCQQLVASPAGAGADREVGVSPLPHARNFRVVLGQSAAVSVGSQLTAPTAVLPFICIALGGSPIAAFMIFPVYSVGRGGREPCGSGRRLPDPLTHIQRCWPQRPWGPPRSPLSPLWVGFSALHLNSFSSARRPRGVCCAGLRPSCRSTLRHPRFELETWAGCRFCRGPPPAWWC